MADDVSSTIDLQGRGILFPLRRDQKNDFATGSGVEAMKANIRLALGTHAQTNVSPGEVAWDGTIGSSLHLLTHRLGTVTLNELARHYVVRAIRVAEPRARITTVRVVRDKKTSYLDIKFVPTDGNGNAIGEADGVEIPLPDR
jgi:phage baseplate assembly protein W